MGTLPGGVEKIMALELAEFHRSLKTLAPDVPLEDGQTDITVATDKGSVRIVYEPLERATLGGLLALPCARVTLHLGGLGAAEKLAFLTRFERAFQRGGG